MTYRFPTGLTLRAASLHTKLMLALGVLVALVVAGSAYFVIERERDRRLLELEERAEQFADLLSRSLAQPLWNVDRKAIDSQLAALSDYSEVAEFSVTAVNYGPVSTVTGAHAPGATGDVVRVRRIEYAAFSEFPAQKIGEVRVVLSQAVTDEAIAGARRAIVLIAAAVIATLYAATFVLLKRMVRDPVNRLEEMVDRIAGGDLHARCTVESGDELGRLAARVNAMADQLRESTARLHESERKYRGIFENALEGIFQLDRRGCLREANPAMAQLIGYATPAALMSAVNEERTRLFTPAQTDALFETLASKGEIASLELQLTRLDGSPIWVQLNARGLAGSVGDPPCLEGLLTDITARKQAEEALRRSEAYLAEAQRLTHTGIWARSIATGEPTHSSEEHSRLFGFKPERDVPSLEEFRQRIHPEDRARVLEIVERAVRERTDFAVDFRTVLPDGTIEYLHGIGHPVFNASGHLIEYIGTAMDVTERKRADEERERLLASERAALTEAVAASEALHKAQAELAHVTRVTTPGELAASIAHEVNQPLTAVITNGNACLRWLTRDPPNLDEAREAVRRMIRDGNRASEVIARIRAPLRKAEPQKARLAINDVIGEVIALAQDELRRNGVALHADLAADLPPVLADRVQLQQVLLNLLLNGMEAMRTVTDRPRELIVRSQREEADAIRVAVQDAGTGIDPQDLERIFTPFFTTKPAGLGMGLPISRSIIEAHDGRLWATPNVRPGVTIQFTLPTGDEGAS